MIGRRDFLGFGILSSALLILCDGKLYGAPSPLVTIAWVHRDLFPDLAGVPSVVQTGAISYLERVILRHSRIRESQKRFIRNGAKWLNEEAIKRHGKSYLQLSSGDRQALLRRIVKEEWGDRWLYSVMEYYFEAMLGDPIYGINRAESGWKWLHFHGGIPRPREVFV